MTQQSISWAHIQRKSYFEKIHEPQCSLQHYLQQPGHGSNLNVHQQMNGYNVAHTHNRILLSHKKG